MSAPPVPVKLKFDNVDAFLRSYTENAELLGLFVESNVAVPVGTIIDLTIEFAPGKGLRTLGEVKWTRTNDDGRPLGVGVAFKNMAAAHKVWLDKQLAAYYERNPHLEVDPASATGGHELRKATAGTDLVDAGLDLQKLSASASQVLGIDLGTSNSAACVCHDGKVTFIDLGKSEGIKEHRAMPSVVGFHEDGNAIVGFVAAERLAQNPRRTIFGAKRFMGRVYDSPTVTSMLSRFPYKIVPGPQGRVAVDVDGRPVALTAIASRILMHIKQEATAQLGESIGDAIITVPAYYNDNQRQSVVQAGRLAGLNVIRILNEPTSAAIAYGLTRAKPRRLLVYDLGGGTFDVSVMSVHRNTLQVLSTAGDTFLGGEDFDSAIVTWAVDTWQKQSGKHLSLNSAALALVKEAAEAAKRRLSKRDTTMLMVRSALLRDGTTARIELELSREQLHRLVDPLIDRTLKICDMALNEARLTSGELGDVILVGGQTHMLRVQEKVRDHFGRAPRVDLNPDEVVAMGAGMLADINRRGEDVELKDVLSMSIGIAVKSRFKPLIPRNTPLPTRKQFTIHVPKKDLANYTIDVWQGDSSELFKNEHLGIMKVDSVTPGNYDPVPLKVEFFLTEDCLLKLRVTHAKTEERQQVILNTRDAT